MKTRNFTAAFPRNAFVLCLFVLLLQGFSLGAQNLSITQLDSSKLFLSSKVDVFLSVTDGAGIPAELANPMGELSFYHTSENGPRPLDILDITRNEDSEEKITFLLVLDNSGSMYETQGSQDTRNRQAVRAISQFVSQLDPEKDRVGLAVFGRDYEVLLNPKNGRDSVGESLQLLRQPGREEGYTELYYAIARAAEDMAGIKGRKAIILLSDGENYPYFERSGNPHPVLGERNYQPRESSEALSGSEVTLYAINFSQEKDLPLADIALASGGRVFDAYNETELTRVYENIRRGIQQEYRVSLKVPISFDEHPGIEARYNGKTGDTRTYTPALLFGSSRTDSDWLCIIILLGGLILWLLLFLIKFERPASRAELQFVPAGSGKTLVKTQILSTAKTVIGSSAKADMTILGIPSLGESHAVIEHNEKNGTYTVVSKEEILVNNQPVKKRELRPGDVLNMEGATLIFDAPEPDSKKSKPR
ncbi:VWA domain-containing protein [Breznakiella homolactica]|uniref:VWA domain-containing protein n=1 Tax=Breznakiella homolactica TaxID=2798577 RepID=A0A7T8BB77_9SPIR|nr:VWA domain-containing protein [Breznakiella homolactica]QQO10262.1 VWA domain-containing protein [Breznakiella homolactica]